MEASGGSGVYICIVRSSSCSMPAEFACLDAWGDFNCVADCWIALWKRHIYNGVCSILCSQHFSFEYL